MEKVSFVILHFLNIEDTLKCINSIKENILYENYNIVVVDNGSPNQTGEELARNFQQDPKVKVILAEKNLGFAKGNNIGYEFARNVLKSKFIIVINNDIFIEQSNFIDLLIARYNLKPYYILGPDIISLVDKSHQNPRTEILTSPRVIKGFIKRYKLMYLLSLFNLDLLFVQLKKKILPQSNLPTSLTDIGRHTEELDNVKLHGSALIFSNDFIRKYEYCFYPDTFMYNEESILFFIAMQDRLTTVYFPEVKVFHKEDGATQSLLKSKKRRRSFYYKNFIKSSKVFMQLMQSKQCYDE